MLFKPQISKGRCASIACGSRLFMAKDHTVIVGRFGDSEWKNNFKQCT